MTDEYRFGDFVLDLMHASCGVEPTRSRFHRRRTSYSRSSSPIDRRPCQSWTLQERLWPDTFVVEKNLVNLVAEIRAALGDDATHPRFVRTVPRFGYAFREAAAAMAETQVTDPSVRFRLRWPDGRAALREGEHVLGRDPDLELFIDATSVSRRHAVIRVSGGEATIQDLGSKNGTFVADRSATAPMPLADGDVIRLGSVELTFYGERALFDPHRGASRALTSKVRNRVVDDKFSPV